jgi:hypothetical protein
LQRRSPALFEPGDRIGHEARENRSGAVVAVVAIVATCRDPFVGF